MKTKTLEEIKKIKNIQINENFDLKNYNSFKLSSICSAFIKVNSVSNLKSLLKILQENSEDYKVIGNGTNLLLAPKIDLVIIKLEMQDMQIIEESKNKVIIKASSGIKNAYLGYNLANENITGFEEITTIPGTLGGAIVQNARCYGKEIKDIVQKVEYIQDGAVKTRENNLCEFSYRNSYFKKHKDCIITSIYLELSKGSNIVPGNLVLDKIRELMENRRQKQPTNFPNAGSFFKRCDGFIVSKAIDELGLKGARVGDAQVSLKHAGFIVNLGNATFEDILELSEYVENKVLEKYNIKIEKEVEIIR